MITGTAPSLVTKARYVKSVDLSRSATHRSSLIHTRTHTHTQLHTLFTYLSRSATHRSSPPLSGKTSLGSSLALAKFSNLYVINHDVRHFTLAPLHM